MKTATATSARGQNWPGVLLLVLFFLLATTWLAGPFVHGQHYGNLFLISDYEGIGQPWGWAFRLADFSSSLVLIILAFVYKLRRADKPIFYLIILYAVVSSLDAIFPLDCSPAHLNHCVSVNDWDTFAHYCESLLTPLAGLALIAKDIRERRNRASIGFFGLQIILGELVLFQLITGQPAVVLEYVYEVVMALWLVYLIELHNPARALSRRGAKWYHLLLAIWIGLSGVLAIVIAAAHLHLYGRGFALYFGQSSAWLAEQGVFVGVLLLYLARQTYRGQRRAVYLLLAIFGFELFNYSLLSPHRLVALVCELALIVLFVTRKTFDRNQKPITLHRRIYDLLTILAGAGGAILIVAIILSSVGRLQHAETLIDRGTDYFSTVYRHHTRRLRHSEEVQATASVLAFAIVAVGLWALFRPSSLGSDGNFVERERARRLIKRYPGSSEDFFKLWPNDKKYFFAADKSGFIAYKIARGTAFALADPVAKSAAARRKLLVSFSDFAHHQGWTVCYLPVEEKSRTLYEQAGFSLLPIGSSALVNVAKFTGSTCHDKWWRWKINRAHKAGLEYALSTPPHDPQLLGKLKPVSDAWLGSGGRREQGFALGYFDEDYLGQCRIHYLKNKSGGIVAFTNELPVFVKRPTTVDLLRYLPGEDSAMPFLLASLIGRLARERKFDSLDLGFVPLAQLDHPAALAAKSIGKVRFSAAGLEQFKGKFDPDWQTNYLAYSGDKIDLAALALKLETALKPD